MRTNSVGKGVDSFSAHITHHTNIWEDGEIRSPPLPQIVSVNTIQDCGPRKSPYFLRDLAFLMKGCNGKGVRCGLVIRCSKNDLQEKELVFPKPQTLLSDSPYGINGLKSREGSSSHQTPLTVNRLGKMEVSRKQPASSGIEVTNRHVSKDQRR